ncbi:hypothetical protein GCM10023216_32700 [Isoptericola chiayiensis]|uniref:Uncharacterized protein n=1 Tax=Isoptericola chiayiensis TaxID=579446 RepID=A0ABP8YT19_9MICO|nr:hypothetical protein [Isoptericola chiayiensis]NOW02332.1 hypothetical protein [Isoptericola chiayiensis]
MTRSSTVRASAVGAALVVATLTACGDSPEENAADACSAWGGYTTALGDLAATLVSSPTVGEVQDARDEVADAYGDLESSLEDVAADRTDAIDDAWDELDDAIDDIDDDDTLNEAVSSVAAQAEAVQAAGDDVTAELGCS